jgi:hypothetical protein
MMTWVDLVATARIWVEIVPVPLACITIIMLIQWARKTGRWKDEHFPWGPRECVRNHDEEFKHPGRCPVCNKLVRNLEIHALRRNDVGHAVLVVHTS